jgi:hypothetical protein
MKSKLLVLFLVGSVATSYGQAITDNGTNVGIGNPSPLNKLDVSGNINMSLGNGLRINNTRILHAVGTRNISIGEQAGNVISSGTDNAFIGYQAGLANTSGGNNAFIGRQAGAANIGGSNSVIIGNRAGFANTSGSDNSFIGFQSGTANTNGSGNSFFGKWAGKVNTTGANNVALGHRAGQTNTTGTQNTYIGYQADGSAALTNATAVGANATATQSNTVILGSGANVGIGTSTPSQKLHVSGSARVTGSFYDSNNSPGNTDYVLTSSVSGTDWRDVCDIVSECAGLAATVGWGEDSVFVTSESGTQARMFMSNPDQLLGIGTLEPTSKVDIRTNGMVAGGSMQAVLNIALVVPPGQNSSVRSAKFTGGNGVEIGNGLYTDRMRISQGAQNGHVLMSNANGDASWSDPVASGISGGWGYGNTLVQTLPPPQDSLENQGPPSTITVAAVQSFAAESTPFIFGSQGIGYDSSSTANATRMTYMPSRAAFRAGYDDQNGWNFNNQGVGSSAFGWNTEASGDYSHASGYASVASGGGSFAHGYNNTASGNGAAFGSSSTAGYSSFAAGNNCTASGTASVALGSYSTASSNNTFAFGYNANASGIYSTAVGFYSTASGARSMSLGFYNTAQSYGETAFGLFGLVGAGNATSFVVTDRLFSIGNGTASNARSNALTILKNSNTGIGNSSPSALLHVGTTTGAKIKIGSVETIEDGGTNFLWVRSSITGLTDNAYSLGTSALRWNAVYAASGTVNTSDAREKKNVKDINYGIETIKKLRPVEYQWISGNDDNKKLGLIAQELQKVIPEVVVSKEYVITNEETNEGEWKEANRLGVYYSDLIPVLIKGMQEQQTQIEELQPAKVVALEEKVAKLESENLSMKQQLEEILSRLNAFDGDLQNCCFNAGQATGVTSNNADAQSAIPTLEQNIPNPFRDNTTIKYYLPSDSRVATISISDMNGLQLKQFDLQGNGFGQVLISGGSFAAGTYVYTLTVNGKQVDSKRMMLL